MPARNTGSRDDHSCDNEKTEHRVLDSERIRDKRTANVRVVWMEAVERGQIRESEERPRCPWMEAVERGQIRKSEERPRCPPSPMPPSR